MNPDTYLAKDFNLTAANFLAFTVKRRGLIQLLKGFGWEGAWGAYIRRGHTSGMKK